MRRTAVVVMRDVSGSIRDGMRAMAMGELAALESWLGALRPGFTSRFIVFDARAREGTRLELETLTASGGTMMSCGLLLCADIVEADYAAEDWDVLTVLFSDGDNWSDEDTVKSFEILRNRLLPRLAAFGYAQFYCPYAPAGVGFLHELQGAFSAQPRVIGRLLEKPGDFAQPFTTQVALVPAP